MAQLGKPYVNAGVGPNGFDCSGLVYYCLNMAGVSIPRYTAAGYSNCTQWPKITPYTALRRGDLIFYWDENHTRIYHVGVYLGNGTYIHASSSHGEVEIADFGSWSQNWFAWGRRVFGS